MITGRSRSVSVVDHQTGFPSRIARGQVDALSPDVAVMRGSGESITTPSRAAIRATPRQSVSRKIGTVQCCRGPVTMEKHPVEDQTSLSRRDRSRRFKVAVAGQYRPVSEAIHGYDERVDVESICRITKSIALFVAEWCGVAEAR